MPLLQLLALTAAAYLLGAVPGGLLIARLRGVDLLARGSGKTGATNTLHALGRPAGVAVFALDLLKGVLAAWAALSLIWPDNVWRGAAVACAGAAAIIGHNRSVWVRLLAGKWGGGRGIVTAFGALLMLNPLVVVAAIAGGLPAILLTRYMVLGALAGIVAGIIGASVLVEAGWLSGELLPACLLWSLLVLVGFGDSISRLLGGKEPRLSV